MDDPIYKKSYEFFYEGTPYAMEPDSGNFTGYRMNFSELSMSQDARTANQIKEVSAKLNMGLKNMEIAGHSAEVFESIPDEHLKEIKRLVKLTGAEVSLHGAVIEPSGFTKQGWNEFDRVAAERQISDVIQRAQNLKNEKKENIIVNFHSSASLPGPEIGPDGKEKRIIAVEYETGKIIPVEEELRYYPHATEGKKYSVKEELETINDSTWDQDLSQVTFYKNRGTEILEKNYPIIAPILERVIKGEMNMKDLNPGEQEAYHQIYAANNFMKNSFMTLNSLYNKAFKAVQKFGTEEEKELLISAAKEYTKKVGEKPTLEKISKSSSAMDEFIEKISQVSPKLYIPLEDFAVEKSANTFSNAALNAYHKFGNNAPIISIENPPAGAAISNAESLKNLVEKTREELSKKLVEKEGLSKSEAENTAKKLIGATWDVGHINMMRKYGYESKDIVKETGKIAPYVKHVHLSDNFGFEHTELPMGMGNVPIKDMMEKLGKEGFKGKKVIEAMSWWQHFSEQGKVPPLMPTLEAFGSPIYPIKMAPYWNQIAGSMGGYFAGQGPILPEQNFSLYGSGFSNLPTELGGQIQGKGSRMTGTPME